MTSTVGPGFRMDDRQAIQDLVNAQWTIAANHFAGQVLIECLDHYLKDFTGHEPILRHAFC